MSRAQPLTSRRGASGPPASALSGARPRRRAESDEASAERSHDLTGRNAPAVNERCISCPPHTTGRTESNVTPNRDGEYSTFWAW